MSKIEIYQIQSLASKSKILWTEHVDTHLRERSNDATHQTSHYKQKGSQHMKLAIHPPDNIRSLQRKHLTFFAGCQKSQGVISLKRSRAYYQEQRIRAINRKKGILKRIGGDEYVFAWARNEPNRLSKGKIHCSCWMCRKKSYDGISHGDAKKLLRFM